MSEGKFSNPRFSHHSDDTPTSKFPVVSDRYEPEEAWSSVEPDAPTEEFAGGDNATDIVGVTTSRYSLSDTRHIEPVGDQGVPEAPYVVEFDSPDVADDGDIDMEQGVDSNGDTTDLQVSPPPLTHRPAPVDPERVKRRNRMWGKILPAFVASVLFIVIGAGLVVIYRTVLTQETCNGVNRALKGYADAVRALNKDAEAAVDRATYGIDNRGFDSRDGYKQRIDKVLANQADVKASVLDAEGYQCDTDATLASAQRENSRIELLLVEYRSNIDALNAAIDEFAVLLVCEDEAANFESVVEARDPLFGRAQDVFDQSKQGRYAYGRTKQGYDEMQRIRGMLRQLHDVPKSVSCQPVSQGRIDEIKGLARKNNELISDVSSALDEYVSADSAYRADMLSRYPAVPSTTQSRQTGEVSHEDSFSRRSPSSESSSTSSTQSSSSSSSSESSPSSSSTSSSTSSSSSAVEPVDPPAQSSEPQSLAELLGVG